LTSLKKWPKGIDCGPIASASEVQILPSPLLTKGESMKEITPKWLEEQEREILQQLKKLEMPVIEMGRALFFQLAKRINEYFNESEAKQ